MDSLISLPCNTPAALVFYLHTYSHTQSYKHTHTLCVTCGLSVLSTAAWGNGARLSLSPTSQLNIEPKGKCSTHLDNHDHTQSSWKVVYRAIGWTLGLGEDEVMWHIRSAQLEPAACCHITLANADEHWQTLNLCSSSQTHGCMCQTVQTNLELHNVLIFVWLKFLCRNRLQGWKGTGIRARDVRFSPLLAHAIHFRLSAKADSRPMR